MEINRRSAGLWGLTVITATVVLMVALAVTQVVSWGVAAGLIAGVIFTLALLYIFFGHLNAVQKTGYASLLGVVLIALFIPLFWLGQNASQASFQNDTYTLNLKRGAALYGTYCLQCHGSTGQGYSAPTLNTPASTNANSPTVNNLTDDDITRIISAGVPANANNLTTQGLAMPAWSDLYGGPLTQDDISYLVALIRSSDPNYLKTNHINDMTNGFDYVYGQLTTQAAIDLYNKYKGHPSNYGEQVDMTSKAQVAMQIINTSKNTSGWDFQYTNIKIKVGTTVTWTNISSAPHTVTSGQDTPDGKFDSRGPNQTSLLLPNNAGASSVFSFTFKTPGTYYYYCTLHPSMIGEIVVVAG
jgi:plastocyanin/mono/diheme cytochrome c family protein